MDPERLRWLRELIRSIPGYGTAKRAADRITDASLGAFDAAQSFGTRTVADAEGSYNFFAPEAIESDYFGRLEEDTARRLAEEDRSGLRRGAQIAGELGLTGAEYIGLGGGLRRGATGLLRPEVAEQGASRLSRMGVSAREALRDAAAVAPLDAVSSAREGHSTADFLTGMAGEPGAETWYGRAATESAPGRMVSEMLLGLGADLGLRGTGHAVGAARDAAPKVADDLARVMGDTRGSLVLPDNPRRIRAAKAGNLEEVAAMEFGETDDVFEAGYVLQDGRMLDFSEKADGGQPGMRSADHRQISAAYPDDSPLRDKNPGSAAPYMWDFVSRGNIRFSRSGSTLLAHMAEKPTRAQVRRLEEAMDGADSVFLVRSVGEGPVAERYVDPGESLADKLDELFSEDGPDPRIGGFASPSLVAGIARTGLGATAGAAAAPEGEKLEGAIAGGALAAGAPALVRGARQMGTRGSMVNPTAPRTGRVPGQVEGGMRGRWFSRLQRSIEQAPQERAPAEQWLGMIRNAKGGQAGTELEWTGIEEALTARGSDNLTRSEVLDLARQNEIRLGETVRGYNPRAKARLDELDARLRERGRLEPGEAAEYDRLVNEESLPRTTGAAPQYGQYTVGSYGQRPESNYREITVQLGVPKRESSRYTVQGQRGNWRVVDTQTGQTKALLGGDGAEAWREADNLNRVDAGQQAVFPGGHGDPANTLARLRVTDRTVNGERVMFVEEIQSDWHQKGRTGGYGNNRPGWIVADETGGPAAGPFQTRSEAVAAMQADPALHGLEVAESTRIGAVPDAPFKKTDEWVGLAFRRALQEAVEGGYDRLAWISGEQAAALYPDMLRRLEIDRIDWKRNADGTFDVVPVRNRGGFEREVIEPRRGLNRAQLEETVGKHEAANINAATDTSGSILTDEFEVGAEGMHEFYNRIVPGVVRKEAKRLGVEIEPVRVGADDVAVRRVEGVAENAAWPGEERGWLSGPHYLVESTDGARHRFPTREEADRMAEVWRSGRPSPPPGPTNLSIRITPKARDIILNEGQRIGAAVPAVPGAIGRAAVGSVVGGMAAPEDRRLEGALAGGALAAGAPALARGLRGMDPVGGWMVPDSELVAKFRAALTDLSDDDLIARYQKYNRGRALTESDAASSLQRDAARRVDDSANVYAGTRSSESGMNARGRDTQQRARLAAAEAEMQARGLEVPKDDPYLDVKPSEVTEANRELVTGLRTMSDDELHAAIVETIPKANPSDNVMMERMAILHAEATRAGRDVQIDRALNGEPPIKRPGIAPAFQKAPDPTLRQRRVSLRNADGAALRAELGLDELPPAERMSMEEKWDEATERGLAAQATLIARDAVATKRGLEPVEIAAAVQRSVDLKVELADARNTLELAARAMNDDVVRIESQRITAILDELNDLTEAMKRSGTDSARSLAARRWMAVDEDTFSFAAGVQEARTRAGRPLAQAELAKFDEMRRAMDALEAENVQLRDRAARLEIVKQEQLAIATAEAEAKAARRTRNPNRVKKLETEQVDLKAQLAKLGVRLNDLTGVSAEGVYLIGKLAKNHIELAVARGAQNIELSQIVDGVLRDLNNPQITARDIYEAMNARAPKAISEQRRAVQATVARLKTQARLLTRLEDAENGLFQPGRKRPPTAPEIQRLRDRLSELRRAAYQSGFEARRIERAIQTINDLSDKLANHARAVRRKQPIPSQDLADLQTRIRGLRQEMRVEDTLSDLENQLKTGEFKQPYKPKSPYTTPELERNQIALRRARAQWREAIAAMEPATGRSRIREGANFLRTVKATADMSATLRQGLWLSTSRPATAMQAFGKSARAFFSTATAEQIDNAIRQHPNQLIRDMSGLQLADLDGVVSQREEMFASKLAERLPVFGDLVKASNRSMTTTLNLLRTAAFDDFVAKFPNATTDELRAWANWVNVASGRGELDLGVDALKSLRGAGEAMSLVIFAPRFAASRIQTPGMVVRHWQHPRVRQAIARDMAATVGLGLTALVLADAAGLDVGVNPRESDFGKIRFGDTRIDLWGGVQQPVRLLTRAMLRGTDEYGLTGEGLPASEKEAFGLRDLVGQFAAFKLAPAVTLPMELVERKTAVGEDTEPSETLMRSVMPLVWEDVYETYRLAGPEAAAVSGMLNFLGASTQTFGDSEAATRRKIRSALDAGDTPEARQMLQDWNRANPDNPIRRVQ